MAEIKLVLLECPICGVPFGITEDRIGRLRESHEDFYCPMGHKHYYPAKTKEEVLREQLYTGSGRIAELENELAKKCRKNKPKKKVK